ncbi:unnamed protein product [Amoebophrya sp. A25]|nr:unnamed protein product [Amoebophrya sp. A25]|eukprot:GSA25T00009392001.1
MCISRSRSSIALIFKNPCSMDAEKVKLTLTRESASPGPNPNFLLSRITTTYLTRMKKCLLSSTTTLRQIA